MNFERLSADQFQRGSDRLRDAERALQERRWPDALRFSQESVELILKALLRSMGVEVPKRHDVGPALRVVTADLPRAVRRELPWILELSVALAERRSLAMYGDEPTERPATEIFHEEEVRRFLEQSRRLAELVGREMLASRRRRRNPAAGGNRAGPPNRRRNRT